MKNWNVPLLVISNIKKIVSSFFLSEKLPIDYKLWIDVLSQRKIKNTLTNWTLLNEMFIAIKDNHIDYHIMNLEGLLSASAFEEEPIPLRDKMQHVYDTTHFENIREQYERDINKKKLLVLEMIKNVSHMQVNEFIILKYEKVVSFYDLWNEFYMETRGVILDLKDMELVSVPYRKFYNFNEKPITSAERIYNLLKKAEEVIVKNKEDGSMISVTKYKDNIIVSTPGSMESDQAKWAKSFLYKYHLDFINAMPKYITFLFEAIYPENRIVIDYQGEEKLVLTNMRSILNGTYFSDDVVNYFALLYQMPTPVREYKSLNTLLEEAKNKELYPADKKEGWVFRVKTVNEDFMFKLKCDDYVEIHKIMGVANSPKIVLEHVMNDSFDDFISRVPDVVKDLVLDIAEAIFSKINQIEKEGNHYLSLIPEDILYTNIELEENVEFKRWVKEEIVPLIDTKLSKNIRNKLEESLYSKAYGKEPYIEKYYQKEFQRLWDMLPLHLRDQKIYKQKEGRLLGHIHKHIPFRYRAIAFDYAKKNEINFKSLIDIKEIDFAFIKNKSTEE